MANTSVSELTWFCGGNNSKNSDREWKIYDNYCMANFFTACVHLFFLLATCAILIILGCCTSLRQYHSKTLLQFPGHFIKWTISILLCVVLLIAIGEGVLTDVTRNSVTAPHLYVPDSIAFVTVIMVLVLYHHLECWNKPHLAWFLLLYWILAVTGEIFRLVSLSREIGFDLNILRFVLLILTSAFYAVCALVEINLLRTKVFRCCYQPKPYPRDLKKKSMYFYYKYTNFLSQTSQVCINWLFALGYKQPLEIQDLGCPPEEFEAQYQYKLFNNAYEKQKLHALRKGQTASLWKTYGSVYGRDITIGVVWVMVSAIFVLIPTISVGSVVAYASDWYYDKLKQYDTDMVSVTEYFSNGFVLVGVIFVSSVLKIFALGYGMNVAVTTAVKVKTALQTHTYEKALHLSSWALSSGDTTAGKITNHMSVDAIALQNFLVFCPQIGAIPFRIVIILIFLYLEIGFAALIGASIFIIVSPLQYGITKMMAKVQGRVLKVADKRLKRSNEVLMGIKLLKLYGWEEKFCSAIEVLRNLEVKQMMKRGGYTILTTFVATSTPILLTFISFAVYSLTSPVPLTPEVAFGSLALFNLLVWPMSVLPTYISNCVNAAVSTQRLRMFFAAAELAESHDGRKPLGKGFGKPDENDEDSVDEDEIFDHDSVDERTTFGIKRRGSEKADNHKSYGSLESNSFFNETDFGITLPDHIAVQIKNGSFAWGNETLMPVLSNINADIPKGKVTMVVGLVGSGKSSLLSAILGEMNALSGTVKFNRHYNVVSYVAQKPWLQNAPFKENILFGNEMNSKRYRKVIEVCQLQADIDILPAGDMTEIGEKGINLSGGQKQRVSVARALYSNSSVIILDDPLSALDVHVGSHLMERGIMNFAMNEGRTVILVTHQVQYLQYADKVILLEGGKILLQGNPDEIAVSDPVLFANLKEKIQLSEVESEIESDPDKHTDKVASKLNRQLSNRDGDAAKMKPGGRLIEKEERKKGSVSWKIYLTYAKAVKFPLVSVIVLFFLAQGAAQILTNFWLARWSESGEEIGNKTEEELKEELDYYLGGYGILSMIYVLLACSATTCHILFTLFAAKRLHLGLLRNIIRAPMRFFDTTPVGRILNRLSNDTQIIDQRLNLIILELMTTTVQCLAVLVVNTASTPVFMAAVLPVIVVYLIYMKYYLTTSRELKRLDSVSVSPVFSHLSETLTGVTTIRAYRDDVRFRQRLAHRMDTNVLTQLYLLFSTRWLGIRLDFLGCLIILASGLSTMLSCVLGDLQPSLVGLSLTYALTVPGLMSGLVRSIGDCEIQMNAVERVDYYTHIETEEYQGLYQPPFDWPTEGNIEFKSVSVRYSNELDPVLYDVNIELQQGQKIGICGRTGSGKSSLSLSLFRMIDIFKGSIMIDGVNIATVPLLTLRSRLTVIPQDPVLFSGTIRFNLDPDGIYNDEELWHALEISQMKQTVLELNNQLDADVSEEGDNFSVGQRQLFCLARAFLRKARILVMDEATASIDIKTEAILRDVIKTVFTDVTVLTIAHRITSIMDCDMILVLSDGRVVEYDTPKNLLDRPDSVFADLVQKSTQ
ncbi:ATP-binding cassette sub-family C member 9-like [Ptychodera flava]|uniref:ATP-binding cassette sub-family C member 9-like n=1 Tax=Ptychodera flava TaxID=63121 RepID=UPI00396A102F